MMWWWGSGWGWLGGLLFGVFWIAVYALVRRSPLAQS